MPDLVLCRLSDLDATGARGPIRVDHDGRAVSVFVVRHGDVVRAYEDSCPHAFVPLEMEADRFLDLTGTYVLCTMHGAHFEIATGTCVLGPCRGRHLTPYPIRVVDGAILRDAHPNGL